MLSQKCKACSSCFSFPLSHCHQPPRQLVGAERRKRETGGEEANMRRSGDRPGVRATRGGGLTCCRRRWPSSWDGRRGDDRRLGCDRAHCGCRSTAAAAAAAAAGPLTRLRASSPPPASRAVGLDRAADGSQQALAERRPAVCASFHLACGRLAACPEASRTANFLFAVRAQLGHDGNPLGRDRNLTGTLFPKQIVLGTPGQRLVVTVAARSTRNIGTPGGELPSASSHCSTLGGVG